MKNILKPGRDFIGVGVFALVKNSEGKIILTKAKSSEKKGKDYEGIWSMPGGTVEFGETCEDALRREIKEELGVDISDIVLINYNDYIKDGKHWLAINFSAKTEERAQNLEEDKNEEVACFGREEVPENISPYTRECCKLSAKS